MAQKKETAVEETESEATASETKTETETDTETSAVNAIAEDVNENAEGVTLGRGVIDTGALIQRKHWGDKNYFDYYIDSIIAGEAMRVHLTVQDNGAFRIMNLLFKVSAEVKLVKVPYKRSDSIAGTVKRGFTYEAFAINEETGEVFRCPVQPKAKSDGTLLTMLFG